MFFLSNCIYASKESKKAAKRGLISALKYVPEAVATAFTCTKELKNINKSVVMRHTVSSMSIFLSTDEMLQHVRNIAKEVVQEEYFGEIETRFLNTIETEFCEENLPNIATNGNIMFTRLMVNTLLIEVILNILGVVGIKSVAKSRMAQALLVAKSVLGI